MKENIKLLCNGEIYSLGLKYALQSDDVKIIKNQKSLSERDILITDRYFYNMIDRKRTIMIYDDVYKAILGNEKIRVLRSITLEELSLAIKAAKYNKSYTDSEILKKELELKDLLIELEVLNKREKELVKGILANLTNYEISKALYLSEKTIKNNLTELYKKLRVNSREELREKIYRIKS